MCQCRETNMHTDEATRTVESICRDPVLMIVKLKAGEWEWRESWVGVRGAERHRDQLHVLEDLLICGRINKPFLLYKACRTRDIPINMPF